MERITSSVTVGRGFFRPVVKTNGKVEWTGPLCTTRAVAREIAQAKANEARKARV